MEDLKPRALSIVRISGPLLPVTISKQINCNILFASAILSELASNKQVLITNTKRGGSPFYYIKGQEFKLQELGKYLQDKEKEAYDLLKEKRVVRDRTALPWQRVALREIKDFAIPIDVGIQEEVELFWKWYLLPDEEAKNFIKKIITEESLLVQEKPVEQIKEELEEQKQPVKPLERQIEKPQEMLVEKLEVKLKPIIKEKVKFEEITKKEEIDFNLKINSYFKNNSIMIIEREILRKNKDINFIINLPSKIGNLTYFVKAKNKKTITDADFLLAFNEGQQKKLPVLFLSSGKLTKKAEKHLQSNKNLIFKNL